MAPTAPYPRHRQIADSSRPFSLGCSAAGMDDTYLYQDWKRGLIIPRSRVRVPTGPTFIKYSWRYGAGTKGCIVPWCVPWREGSAATIRLIQAGESRGSSNLGRRDTGTFIHAESIINLLFRREKGLSVGATSGNYLPVFRNVSSEFSPHPCCAATGS